MRQVYGDRGDFFAEVGNIGAACLLPGLARSMGWHVTTEVLPVTNKGRSLPDVRLSDHSSFRHASYDAVMVARDAAGVVVDTAYLKPKPLCLGAHVANAGHRHRTLGFVDAWVMFRSLAAGPET